MVFQFQSIHEKRNNIGTLEISSQMFPEYLKSKKASLALQMQFVVFIHAWSIGRSFENYFVEREILFKFSSRAEIFPSHK